MANIYDGEEKLFYVSAEGEYNAVTNTLVRAEGHAELCKPWEVMDGAMIISNVAGDALVINNKLKRVHGKADVALPKWNITGGVDVSWSNETGADVYEGSGWLNVKLLGGKVDGKVTIMLRRRPSSSTSPARSNTRSTSTWAGSSIVRSTKS
jgi:hypothetical protein